MTQQRDLKRRVRERQARTGESYMTALRHVHGEAAAPAPSPSAIPVVELVDLSPIADALGLTCRALVMPALLERLDGTAILTQLRGVLRTTAGDPAFATLRAVVLHGEPLPRPMSRRYLRVPVIPDDTLRFAARVRAGVGGVSSSGQMLAFSVVGRDASELVVFTLWQVPPPYDTRPPALLVTSPDQLAIHVRFDREGAPPP